MKRSLDFEEIESINTLQQGNYKIFKICSKEEVETSNSSILFTTLIRKFL